MFWTFEGISAYKTKFWSRVLAGVRMMRQISKFITGRSGPSPKFRKKNAISIVVNNTWKVIFIWHLLQLRLRNSIKKNTRDSAGVFLFLWDVPRTIFNDGGGVRFNCYIVDNGLDWKLKLSINCLLRQLW